MDVCKSEKHAAVDSRRLPLVPAERNGNAQSTPRRPRTREISSRYKSPAPSTTRRCPSPSQSRTLPTVSQAVPKRAHSAERRRPSTPPSPPSPSTPVRDSSVDVQLPSRRLSTGGRLPESLWPSTMRSLSVSFQSDTISIPISKKEKPVNNISSDRTLRPSSNVAHKQEEAPPGSRKPTPERKRSPLKGKNVQDQSENAKPVEGLHGRLIDQHRWPSRVGGKISSNSLNKSVDQSDKAAKSLSTPGIGSTSLRRLSVPGGSIKPLQKSASDAATVSSLEDIRRRESEASSADDSLLQVSGSQKHVAASLSERWHLQIPAVRTHSLPSPGLQSPSPSRTSFPSPRLHPPSPSRTSLPSHGLHPPSPSRNSVSRGASPARARPSTPPSRGVSPTPRGISSTPSRLVSPTRATPSSISSQMDNSISVFSFIVDFKKGKKAGNYMEDVHQIRLLHNRYLQWRFANARAEAALYIQEETAENTLYNVWNTALTLRDSVIRKRINLARIKLEHKLSTILNHQMAYLDEWALVERDHISSLAGAVEDLEATTLRVPVTGGAKADMNCLKAAISSAVDVMQAMGSSICSSLSKVEGVNRLVSELAIVVAQEKAMLNECNALLASTAALQVEEYSICTHLIQTKQVIEHQPVLAAKGPY